MSKTHVFVATVFALLVALGTPALADMQATLDVDATSFTQEIEFGHYHYNHSTHRREWTNSGEYFSEQVDGAPGAFSYSHDLTAGLDLGPTGTEVVTCASLALVFRDDSNCSNDGAEYVYTTLDGQWVDLGNSEAVWRWTSNGWTSTDGWTEVGSGQYSPAVDLDWINDDGVLSVVVTIDNHDYVSSYGDVKLMSSTLTGCYEAVQCVPVPGAALLGILGLGAAGMRLRKRS